MPNIATALKSEIARITAKVVRKHVAPIQSAAQAQRKQLSALRKQVQQLERELARLRRAPETAAPTENDDGGAQVRFSAKGLRSLRKRLGLSAEDFGRLLSVGAQTVYNWEQEKTSPRPAQIPVIASLRKIGKREALARLEQSKVSVPGE